MQKQNITKILIHEDKVIIYNITKNKNNYKTTKKPKKQNKRKQNKEINLKYASRYKTFACFLHYVYIYIYIDN